MSTATTHPVVLYGRASQARDGRNKSVADQLADLHRWAQREGWPVIAAHRDDGISASRFAGKDRPGWRQVMDVISSGKVAALLVWDLSRASRDKAVFTALETACTQHRVKIGYGGMLRDPATADGSFYVGLDGLMAAKLSADISEKVQRAVDSRAATGDVHAALPYGYRRVFDARGRTAGWEIHPEQGPVVEEIVRRLLAREPAEAIAADLNRRGITTIRGRGWRGGNLSKLAVRPSYARLRTYHGRVLPDVEATWPEIISVAEHHQLRALFASPERDKFRNTTGVKYLGSGLYRCGREGCDGRMRVVVQAGRPPRYDCRECHKISRYQPPVDKFVEAVLVERLCRPDALAALTGPDSDEQRRAAAAEAAQLRSEEIDMQRLVREGQLTPVDLAAWRAGWTSRYEAAEQAARPPHLSTAVTEMVGVDAAGRWAAAPIGSRRAVLDTLLVVTILPVHRGGQPFDPDMIRISWKGAAA